MLAFAAAQSPVHLLFHVGKLAIQADFIAQGFDCRFQHIFSNKVHQGKAER